MHFLNDEISVDSLWLLTQDFSKLVDFEIKVTDSKEDDDDNDSQRTLTDDEEDFSSQINVFHCPHCSYKTDKKPNLRQHSNFHNNGKNFACKLCPRKYQFASGLYAHVKNKHK